MYALHVTFTSAVSSEDLHDGQVTFAEHLVTVPGFVSKTWLYDGDTQGGFYVFDSGEAAQAYVNGPLFALLRGNPAFTALTVRGYQVQTELGARTGAGRATSASAR